MIFSPSSSTPTASRSPPSSNPPQIRLTHNRLLVRFSLVHLLAVNLLVWFESVIHEAAELFSHSQDSANSSSSSAHAAHASSSLLHVPSTSDLAACPSSVHTSSHVARDYLFPCLIEYSLLASGSLLNLLQQRRHPHDPASPAPAPSCSPPAPDRLPAANVGLLLSLLLTVTYAVVFIGEFVFQRLTLTSDDFLVAFVVATCALYILNIILVVAAAVRMLPGFAVVKGGDSVVERLLLYISFAGNLLFGLFSVMAEVGNLRVGNVYPPAVSAVMMLSTATQFVAVLLQTPFLLLGLTLRSASDLQRRVKPGRSLLTLLLVVNLLVWVHDSLHLKAYIVAPHYVAHYGALPWCLIASVCLPLLIFFRFHCASITAEILTHVYK